MATPQKAEQVKELEQRFHDAQALVLTDFRGIGANEMVELRKKLKSDHLEYRVVKNRLALIAADQAGLALDSLLEGPTAICFGYDDPVRAFKRSVEVRDSFPAFRIKGGVSEGQLLDAKEAEALAKIPSREVLLAQVGVALRGPIQHLTVGLNGLLQQLVVAISEVAKVERTSAAREAPEGEESPSEGAAEAQDEEMTREEDEAETEPSEEGEEKGKNPTRERSKLT